MNMESNDHRTGADGAQRDHQHELLCKLVFGEASDAERAETRKAAPHPPIQNVPQTIQICFKECKYSSNETIPSKENNYQTAQMFRKQKNNQK